MSCSCSCTIARAPGGSEIRPKMLDALQHIAIAMREMILPDFRAAGARADGT